MTSLPLLRIGPIINIEHRNTLILVAKGPGTHSTTNPTVKLGLALDRRCNPLDWLPSFFFSFFGRHWTIFEEVSALWRSSYRFTLQDRQKRKNVIVAHRQNKRKKMVKWRKKAKKGDRIINEGIFVVCKSCVTAPFFRFSSHVSFPFAFSIRMPTPHDKYAGHRQFNRNVKGWDQNASFSDREYFQSRSSPTIFSPTDGRAGYKNQADSLINIQFANRRGNFKIYFLIGFILTFPVFSHIPFHGCTFFTLCNCSNPIFPSHQISWKHFPGSTILARRIDYTCEQFSR